MDGQSRRAAARTLSRRSLLLATGGLVAARAAQAGTSVPFRPSHAHDYPTVPNLGLEYRSPRLRPYVDPLPIPPRRPIGGTLRIAEARHRFHRDLPPAPSWGYGGQSHGGPVLIARPGDAPPTRFSNELGGHLLARDLDVGLHGTSREDRKHPQTVVHLHGAPNRPEDDGHPMASFRPGESATYRFRLPDESATLWYHDHAMGSTRLSVYAGLAAPVWVRDAYDTGEPDNPLGLPTGAHEVPLLITDKLFGQDGRLRYQGTPINPQDQWGGGLCGDVIVVNGKAWPYLDVDRAVYRFRVINGAPLNDYRLVLSDRAPFWVIGSDGGLLDEPALVEELDIAPGERYDILVDFSDRKPGSTVDLENSMQIAWAGQLIGAVRVRQIMRFRIGDARGPVTRIPKRLRGGARQPALLPAVAAPPLVRTATLNTGILHHFRNVATLMMNINNLRWTDPGFDTPEQGTYEQWEFVNCDALFQVHAMHVHLVQFRVIGRQDLDVARYLARHPAPGLGHRWAPSALPFLRRNQVAPAPYERGWKDTVRCPPGMVTRVAVRWPSADELGFDPDAAFAGTGGQRVRGYVWHCHLLDHEDHEMMLPLRIVRPGASTSDAPSVTGQQAMPDMDAHAGHGM